MSNKKVDWPKNWLLPYYHEVVFVTECHKDVTKIVNFRASLIFYDSYFNSTLNTTLGKVPLFLLCRIISVECPTNLNLAPLLSIVVYTLDFWFQFDLVLYICQ